MKVCQSGSTVHLHSHETGQQICDKQANVGGIPLSLWVCSFSYHECQEL